MDGCYVRDGQTGQIKETFKLLAQPEFHSISPKGNVLFTVYVKDDSTTGFKTICFRLNASVTKALENKVVAGVMLKI